MILRFVGRSLKPVIPVCLLLLGLGLPVSVTAGEIKNTDFAEWTGDRPGGWTVRHNRQRLAASDAPGHATAQSALRVQIVANAGGKHGEILQKLRLEPYTRYRITADVRSSEAGLAFLQVKTIANSSQLERLSSPRSTTDWTTVALEFDTRNADEVQVLCRYNQRASNIGQTGWWTNLTVTELGPGAEPIDPMHLEIAPPGVDQYVTPQGAGQRDGSSWEHARSAADGLQDALDRVGPGNTLYIGSGRYEAPQLKLAAGGKPDAPITITGVDTGNGLPVFVSTFDKGRPGKTGKDFFRAEPHVGFVHLERLRVHRHRVGAVLFGPNRGWRIDDLDVTDGREGIIINGVAIPHREDSGSHDILVTNCDFTNYTKQGVRIRGGVHDIEITDCHADAGGEPWATERFAMGFTVGGSKAEGVIDRRVTYRRCTGRNHVDPNGKKYWNADGFVAERGTSHITYIDCAAFDNTDGGWDIKADHARLIRCVAMRNKRNFRVWSRAEAPEVFEDCLGAFAVHYGGTGNANGLHVNRGTGVTVRRSTFAFNGQAIDIDGEDRATRVTLEACLVYEPEGRALVRAGNKVTSQVVGSTVLIDPENLGSDPSFVNASPEWGGGDNAFDSQTYPDLGYRYIAPPVDDEP